MNLEKLVCEAQAGIKGQEAFAEVCRRFTSLVKKYANQPHLTGLKEEATAEGWLAVVKAVRTYKPDQGNHFAGYVDSQVKYAVWNLFKRERRRWQQELPLARGGENDEEGPGLSLLATLAAADNVEEMAETNFVNYAIQMAIRSLPDKQRLVISKTLLQNRRLADVAHELGISPQAVHGLRQRGLIHVKAELAKSLDRDCHAGARNDRGSCSYS